MWLKQGLCGYLLLCVFACDQIPYSGLISKKKFSNKYTTKNLFLYTRFKL